MTTEAKEMPGRVDPPEHDAIATGEISARRTVVKNWTYGAKAASINGDLVAEQIQLAHRYRNKLCELERARRDQVEQVLRDMAPDYVAARDACEAKERQVEELAKEISQQRAAARKRSEVPPADREAYKAARAELKELRQKMRETKRASVERADIQSALKATTEAHRDAVKAARGQSGLYWGTYLTVEDAAKTFGKGAPPRFERFEGEGKVAVQLQNGLSTDELLRSDDNRLRLSVPPDLLERLIEHGKCHGQKAIAQVSLRIGSTGKGNREPIMATAPVVLHRPLPPGQIKWAYLEKTRIASDDQWQLRLSIETQEPLPVPPPTADGVVAVHLGWRKMETGQLRVAVAADSSGRKFELRLPARELSLIGKLESIQSIRDQRMNAMRDSLTAWLAASANLLPEWLREATSHLAQWRSPARMASLAVRWRGERFTGDEGIFAELEAWRKKDKHLWLWVQHARAKQRRRRVQLYREFARDLHGRYEAVVIGKIDLKELLEREDVIEERTVFSTQRRAARLASPASLVQFLKERLGPRLVEVSGHRMTIACHACGEVHEWNRVRLKTVCPHCKAQWDQDHNAARNVLSRGEQDARMQVKQLREAAANPPDDADGPRVSERQRRFREARERRRKEQDGEQS